ncbi:hypothetical protein AB0O32_15740 [Streptomyces rubiginosohelvolus]|uniref:hypothetical protein n=1 Tax=Streptomyces rubiginosohelvolus TaxID=67362 RepID=UPI003429D4F9
MEEVLSDPEPLKNHGVCPLATGIVSMFTQVATAIMPVETAFMAMETDSKSLVQTWPRRGSRVVRPPPKLKELGRQVHS